MLGRHPPFEDHLLATGEFLGRRMQWGMAKGNGVGFEGLRVRPP